MMPNVLEVVEREVDSDIYMAPAYVSDAGSDVSDVGTGVSDFGLGTSSIGMAREDTLVASPAIAVDQLENRSGVPGHNVSIWYNFVHLRAAECRLGIYRMTSAPL